MSNIWLIFTHEIKRVLTNKKMLIAIFIMPVILVVLAGMLIYLQQGKTEDEVTKEYTIYVLNFPIEDNQITQDDIILNIEERQEKTLEQLESQIVLNENVFVLEFTLNRELNIHYYSANTASQSILQVIKAQLLPEIERSWYQSSIGYLSDSDWKVEIIDVSSEIAQRNMTMSKMLPYFMILLLFMSIVGIVSDSIAGEKEKGTLAKLLLSPVGNSNIVAGKIIGNTVLSLLSSIVYVVSLIGISEMGVRLFNTDILGLGAANLNIWQMVLLTLCFVIIGLLFVSLISLVSSYAKSNKEANGMVMPVYILVIAGAIIAMMKIGSPKMQEFIIPVYNISLLMQNIITGIIEWNQIGVTFGSLLVLTAVFSSIVAKNFKSEKLVY